MQIAARNIQVTQNHVHVHVDYQNVESKRGFHPTQCTSEST